MKATRLFLLLPVAMLFFAKASADPLKVGDPAPAVTGVTETGEKLDLASVYKKQTYTLVYFYPKADTSGCTAQGCSLRDGYEALTKKGVAVIGVSHDDVATQKAFKDKYHLPFDLLADEDATVLTAFGVPKTLGFAKRQAFLFKDGKLVWRDLSAATDQQAADVLKVLDAKP